MRETSATAADSLCNNERQRLSLRFHTVTPPHAYKLSNCSRRGRACAVSHNALHDDDMRLEQNCFSVTLSLATCKLLGGGPSDAFGNCVFDSCADQMLAITGRQCVTPATTKRHLITQTVTQNAFRSLFHFRTINKLE
jgi:hypothetical protein